MVSPVSSETSRSYTNNQKIRDDPHFEILIIKLAMGGMRLRKS